MQDMDRTPGSMLEVYMQAVKSKTADDFLDTINLGVGNYNEAEYWEQISSFRNGLYADSAMTRKILERAKRQTQRRMVDAIFEERDARIMKHVEYPDPDEGMSKQEYFNEHMEDVWEDLGVNTPDVQYTTTEHQAWLVHVCTGLDLDWTPPHWRMLKARHEASRSKGARLIDNLFGRPPEPDMRSMEEFQ